MAHHAYQTRGTCSRRIDFDIEEGKLHDIKFLNGCDGNLKAIGILLEARPDFAGEAMPILRIAARDEKDEACRESAQQLVRTHMLGRMPAAASAPTA